MAYRNRFALAVLFVMIAAIRVEAADASQPPAITVQQEGRDVVAAGLTPGGKVAVVAGWWTKWQGFANLGQTWRDATANAAGEVRVTFGRTVPAEAVLAVIDVASGRVQMKVGDPIRYKRVELPEKRFKRDAQREVEQAELPNDIAMIVVVRAGVGAWIQVGYEGANTDADKRNDSVLTIDPAVMRPMAGSPAPPKKIRHKDVILLIDAADGAYGQTEVNP